MTYSVSDFYLLSTRLLAGTFNRIRISMSPSNRKYPNPFLLLGVCLASYASFYYLLQQRQASYPASQQARQRDSPLIPPIHPEDLPKNKSR